MMEEKQRANLEPGYLVFTCPACGAENEVVYFSELGGYFQTTCQKCGRRLGMEVRVKLQVYPVLGSFPRVLDWEGRWKL